MKRLIPSLLLTLLLAGTPALHSADETAELVRPENRLQLDSIDPAWAALIAGLRAQPPLFSEFEEHRYFPFRRDFTRLTGEIRVDPARGLSLHYLSPEESLMVVDAQGGFIVEAGGRRQELPDDPRAQAGSEALLHVLQFDLEALAEDFAIYGEQSAAGWRLAFVPATDALARALQPITVSGEDRQVKRIEIGRTANQRVEIIVGDTRSGVTFTDEEISRYFR